MKRYPSTMSQDEYERCDDFANIEQEKQPKSLESLSLPEEILSNIDLQEEPCYDFYRYACGGFLNNTVIQDGEYSVDQFTKIDHELKGRLRAVLEKPFQYGEPPPFHMVKNMYASCMNMDRINRLGLDALKKVLEIVGGWSVGLEWDDSDFAWDKVMYQYRKIGLPVDYFLDFSVKLDSETPLCDMLNINQPTHVLPREYLIKGPDDEIVQAYYDYMVKLAVHLGAEEERAKSELHKVLEFEILFSNYSLEDEGGQNGMKQYKKMKITELEERWPSIPWLEYINEMLSPFHRVIAEETVVVDDPAYIDNFVAALQATPKRVIANYAIWRMVDFSAAYLTEDVQNIREEFYSKLTGKEGRNPRWLECMHTVSSFSLALGAMYVRTFFMDERVKPEVTEMVKRIQAEFDTILDEVDWMDFTTRRRAKLKSAEIKAEIAYPEWLLDNKILTAIHEGLEITPDHFYQNVLNLSLFSRNYHFRLFREEKKNRLIWIQGPADVNAFYSFWKSCLIVEAGILQGIFYGADRPKYLNYGGIGSVIGHEIARAFHDKGRLYDWCGDLRDWWEPETERKYQEKAKCIIDGHGEFSLSDVGLAVFQVKFYDSFSLALGAMYVRTFFMDERVKPEVTVMVKRIQAEFDTILDEVDWMDFTTRRRAKLKSAEIKAEIAYPEWLLDNKILTAIHEGGIFYGADRPKYLNYGGIGSVIGHEIARAFHDKGRLYDWCGDLRDWWEPETERKYQEKAKCIIDGHGEFSLSDVGLAVFQLLLTLFTFDRKSIAAVELEYDNRLQLNDENPLGESIANSGGLKAAYRAYVKWSEEHGEESPMPGLEHLNSRQIFWISAANVQCSLYKKEALKYKMSFPQPSGESWVRGVFQNIPEFARDFNCSVGTPYNPVERCTIW
ncbi:unnamed protein product [Darwinula stevensoni]|uniref:Uncharacterized protein n=1 Tax=Darwinula stevensoni TaxID=69355 RepID=A0A7R8X874_9CRUS|nr:unnamed protein product [Darwinula stevensoni]CAG0888500.1 unnamed protein product [Darwinula stevensoni]